MPSAMTTSYAAATAGLQSLKKLMLLSSDDLPRLVLVSFAASSSATEASPLDIQLSALCPCVNIVMM